MRPGWISHVVPQEVQMAINERTLFLGLAWIGLMVSCHKTVSIDDEKAAIKNVILLQNKAANEKSISGEAAVWAHAPYAYRRSVSGKYKVGWDSIAAWYQKSFASRPGASETYQETWKNWDIHIFGPMAWAVYNHQIAEGKDTLIFQELRFLEKQKQDWKLIFQQTDLPGIGATNKWPHLENDLNNIGYALLRINKYSEAIKVFGLNVEFFPTSANAYDGLGDAYSAANDKANAKACFKKAVDIDPGNKVSAEKLKKL
jgi:tetratricopeptide (TPR) repeat protein